MSDDDLRRAYDTAWPFPNAHLAGLRAVERAARAAAFDDALREIPTTWLDPLLSGPDKISPLPYNGPAMERLLHALRDRLRARAEGQSNGH